MRSTEDIKVEPKVFDKLIAPLERVLREINKEPISAAAKKLGFALFVRLLLFRLFAQIESLRSLVRDLKSNPLAEQLGFEPLGLSTIHDGFARYAVSWFAALSRHLIENVKLSEIGEVAGLGLLWCVDSSYWPLIHSLHWLKREGLQGVRLHLGLSLNTLCPALFLVSYDKSPTSTERRLLLSMVQAGVTYILDRGYVDIKLYMEMIEHNAYFVIRERNNLCFRVVAEINICLNPAYRFLSCVTDSVVKLNRDGSGAFYRLTHFVVCGHEYFLLTNRWDLTTQQVIMLYAWRWQIELIFRAWKHTLGTLHLINLSEAGIEIQFHILFIASMLWVAFQQQAIVALPENEQSSSKLIIKSRFSTPASIFGTFFRVLWRISKPFLQLLKNSLAQPFSFYIQKLPVLQL